MVAILKDQNARGCILKITKNDVFNVFVPSFGVEASASIINSSRVQISPASIWRNFRF